MILVSDQSAAPICKKKKKGKAKIIPEPVTSNQHMIIGEARAGMHIHMNGLLCNGIEICKDNSLFTNQTTRSK